MTVKLTRRMCNSCTLGFMTNPDKPSTICPVCRYSENTIKEYAQAHKCFQIFVRDQKHLYQATYWSNYGKSFLSPGMVIGYCSPYTRRFFIGIIHTIWSGMRERISVNPIKRPLNATHIIFNQHEVNASDILCLFKLCQETTPLPLATG